MYGLRETPIIIGGAHPDASCVLPLSDGSLPELRKESLAQVCLSFLVKRLDRRDGTFDVRMVPRRLKQITGQAQLQMCGETLLALAESNGDKPPLIVAFDNHPGHNLVNCTLLGVHSDLAGVPFFEKGEVGPSLRVPLFPFKPFMYKGLPVFGANDAAHVLKALAGNLRRACRVVHFGSNVLWCSLSALRCNGLNAASFVGKDCQSDRQAAEVMCSRGPAQWDSFGVTIFQFTSSLILGSFTAARLFEPREIFVNCFSGDPFWYMMLGVDMWGVLHVASLGCLRSCHIP